jgi:hypothetical protein
MSIPLLQRASQQAQAATMRAAEQKGKRIILLYSI